MSSSKDFEKSRILRPFYKEKAKNLQKWKAMVSFCESKQEADIAAFLRTEAEAAFTVFFDRFVELEHAIKRGKTHTQDVLVLLGVLKKLVVHLAESVAKRWKFQMIARIVRKSLLRGNKHAVRMVGFEVLLLLMEIFGLDKEESVESFIVPAFVHAIDLSPLTAAPSVTKKPTSNDALCPSLDPVTLEEVAEMWTFLLTFVTARQDNFDFWYELLKQHYLSAFYSDECKAMGLVVDSAFTFSVAPPEVQRVIIDKLESWYASGYIRDIIWTEVNAPLTMGYCRHAAQLPISYHESILICVKLFRRMLLGKGKRDTRQYWAEFIRDISAVFRIVSKPLSEELQHHVEICSQVLEIYSYYSFELSAELDEELWHILQNTLLNTVHELLSSSDATQVQTIAEVIAAPAVKCLFVTWIRSPFTTPAMWESFYVKLADLLAWKALIVEWQTKTLQLTQILAEHLYLGGGGKEASSLSVTRDAKVSSVDWTHDSIYSMWDIILHCLGEPADIQVSELFQSAMGAVQELIYFLQDVEDANFSKEEKPPINLYEVFTPWLFTAAQVPLKRARGCITSYKVLCRMFIKLQPRPFDPLYVAHFYRIIRNGLAQAHSSIVWCILRNARDIFCVNLLGAEMLIPDFLEQIAHIFRTGSPPPDKVQTHAICILSSIFQYPVHYAELSDPSAPQQQPQQQREEQDEEEDAPRKKEEAMQNYYDQAVQLALLIRDFPKLGTDPRAQILCCFGVIIAVEMDSLRRPDVVKKALDAVLSACPHSDETIAFVALQVISSLSPLLEDMTALDPSLVASILTSISATIAALLQTSRCRLIVHLFYALLELCLSSETVLDSTEVATTVMQIVNMGLAYTGGKGSLTSSTAPNATSPPGTFRGKPARTKTGTLLEGGSEGGSGNSARGIWKWGPMRRRKVKGDADGNQMSPETVEVVETAETILRMLLTHYNNFPTPAGPELMECREYQKTKNADDELNPNTLHWIYNGTTLISLRQVRTAAGHITRVTVRDCTGRYVWDSKLEFTARRALPEPPLPAATRDAPNSEVLEERKRGKWHERSPRANGELPSTGNEYQHDGLFETLSYLHEEHSVILPNGSVFFTEPYEPSNLPSDVVSFYETNLEFQEEEERMHDSEAADMPVLSIRPDKEQCASSFQFPRLLFTQLGFISPEMQETLFFIDNNEKFRRQLAELDKRGCREIIKVAVLRVKQGQETQRDILWNDTRTLSFQSFIDRMAWGVDLATHQGFVGGLPRRHVAPYWASPTIELVFHDTTRMPTNESDPQQIEKKKHVGNDHVSITWSEDYKEYVPEVIKSQFNFVHIIIYPLVNGLFRVQVKKKEQIPAFGPLFDGVVVSASLLPTLVRSTVINANRVVRIATTQVYVRPVQGRSKLLSQIDEKYRIEKDFAEYVQALMPLNITPGYHESDEEEWSPLCCDTLLPPVDSRQSRAAPSSKQRGLAPVSRSATTSALPTSPPPTSPESKRPLHSTTFSSKPSTSIGNNNNNGSGGGAKWLASESAASPRRKKHLSPRSVTASPLLGARKKSVARNNSDAAPRRPPPTFESQTSSNSGSASNSNAASPVPSSQFMQDAQRRKSENRDDSEASLVSEEEEDDQAENYTSSPRQAEVEKEKQAAREADAAAAAAVEGKTKTPRRTGSQVSPRRKFKFGERRGSAPIAQAKKDDDAPAGEKQALAAKPRFAMSSHKKHASPMLSRRSALRSGPPSKPLPAPKNSDPIRTSQKALQRLKSKSRLQKMKRTGSKGRADARSDTPPKRPPPG